MKRLLLLLLFPLPLFAQTGAVTGTALDSVGNVVAGATITVCPQGSSGIPCTPVTASTTSNGQGAFSVTVATGTYTVTVFRTGIVATSSTVVVAPSNITVPNNVIYSGTVTFNQQIISTVSTGTSPLSIASTTVVPNLNSSQLGGLNPPASAIVGISDPQTLTNKTAACGSNTFTGVVCVVGSSNLTAQQANIPLTTLTTPSTNGFYRISCYLVITQAATTSSTLPQCQVSWTDADSNVGQTQVLTLQETTNAVGQTSFTTVNNAFQPHFFAKGGVAIQFNTAAYASSGATPMQYAVHVRLEGPF